MQLMLLAVVLVILSFGFVVLFGAPYVPTMQPQARIAIELINLKPGETLLELGCGDGKMLVMAAQTGVYSVGYELNPLLVAIAWVRTFRYRKYAKVAWGNLWNSNKWPDADGIFVFLMPKYMEKLDKKIMQWHEGKSKPIKLVSFAFTIPGRKPVKQKSGVFLYDYR